MTKEEVEIELKDTKKELDDLKYEYGKLLSRYRVVKSMIHGVMREIQEPETQFQDHIERFPWEKLTQPDSDKPVREPKKTK